MVATIRPRGKEGGGISGISGLSFADQNSSIAAILGIKESEQRQRTARGIAIRNSVKESVLRNGSEEFGNSFYLSPEEVLTLLGTVKEKTTPKLSKAIDTFIEVNCKNDYLAMQGEDRVSKATRIDGLTLLNTALHAKENELIIKHKTGDISDQDYANAISPIIEVRLCALSQINPIKFNGLIREARMPVFQNENQENVIFVIKSKKI